ncbi:MAG: hypothetical protein DMF29_10385 [Verrucomicrobia bacterium]|nr:MAG: hypothetical protein DMF29_10385 [Verrucomicrobiota bacterium]
MKPRLAFILLFLLIRSTFAEETYDSGFEPIPPNPFPAAFKDYQILPGTVSPDRQYGLIYPKRSRLYELASYGLYLAQLKPFRVVTKIPLRYSNLASNAHGSYAVDWAKDSSAVVVVEGIKWGPDKVFLVPLHDRKAGKRVDLTAEVRKQLQPDFNAAHTDRYNGFFDFIFDDEIPGTWQMKDGTVIIQCMCTTDPKGLEGHSWTATFKGIWDIAKGRFVQHEVTRVPPRPNQAMQRTAPRSDA